MKKFFSVLFVSLILKTFSANPSFVNALNTFDAIYNNKNAVTFKWTLENPENMSGVFTIERSKDGKVFEKVSEIKSTLNGQGMIEFMDTDSKPLKKKSYYRLKYTEANGMQSFSRVVFVEKTTKPKLKISVNQDAEGIVFSKFKKDEQVVIVVRDKSGNEFFTKSVLLNNSSQLVLDKEMNLAPGEYVIVASSQSGLYSSTFTVR